MSMTPPPPPPPPPMPPGYTPYQAQPTGGYANWGLRFVARLLDSIAGGLPYYVLVFVGGAIGDAIGALFAILGVVWAIYFFVRTIIMEGRTGQGFGKSVMGIKLVSEKTSSPIGGGMVFGRQILHIVDAIPCYIGFLWPLWDAKRQTFADKILSTVVLEGAQKTAFMDAFTRIAKP